MFLSLFGSFMRGGGVRGWGLRCRRESWCKVWTKQVGFRPRVSSSVSSSVLLLRQLHVLSFGL